MNIDIGVIQHMLDSESFDSFEMEKLLSHYQKNPAIVPCRILKGARIVRSSTNNTNAFHENISRLSYPPAQFARTDRASLKEKPMFYGTVFTSSVKKNPALSYIFSALETTDLLREYNTKGIVFTTQSLWVASKDLHLFAFPFSFEYKKPCEEVICQQSQWKKLLSKKWSKDFCEFSEYIGDLMAKENYSCLYDITSATIDYILNRSNIAKDLDGIMYPSVRGRGMGMNVCLKPKIVDDCLHFRSATVRFIDKSKGESFIFSVANSILLPDGNLKWTYDNKGIDIFKKVYGITIN